jgi:hypothetical protein
MVRFLPSAALLLGWIVLVTGATSVPAQQFRNLAQSSTPPPTPLQNNFNQQIQQLQSQQNQKIIGYQVLGQTGNQGVVGQNMTTPASNISSMLSNLQSGGLNNSNPYLGGPNNYNPYLGGIGQPFNPYANNAALSPYNYNTMMYGTPYGPYPPPNPYYSYYYPYPFMATGSIAGMSPGAPGATPFPTPAQLYNFNLNFAYLNNPYINPLSNPAFSGPFPAGVFNSTAALTIMGMGNLMQNFPLNPNGQGGVGNQGNNSPFP